MSIRYVAKRPKNVQILGEQLYAGKTKRPVGNRFLKAALSERIGTWNPYNPTESGMPTERHFNLFEKWSKGGFGMMITGNIPVDHRHLECAGNVVIDKTVITDTHKEQLKRWAAATKSSGNTTAIAQLNHAGRHTPASINPTPLAASSLGIRTKFHGVSYGIPVPLTTDQVQTEVIDKFAYAASAVRDAGFDGVQLNSSHTDLLAQFFSPLINDRNDRFGHKAGDRLALHREIYEAVRAANPADTGFLVGIKVDLLEFLYDGFTVDQAIEVCAQIDRIGFDFLEIAGTTMEMPPGVQRNLKGIEQFDYTVNVCKNAKRGAQNALIYVTNGFRRAETMVKAVEEKWTDGIGLGRPICAEPDLPNKLLNGTEISALANSFEYDFDLSQLAANAQMEQASRQPLRDQDFCAGISNLSTFKSSKRFKQDMEKYLADVEARAAKGEAIWGVFQYQEEPRS